MSHLTANIFQRPSPIRQTPSFQFPFPRPGHPLSPPDTEQEFMMNAAKAQTPTPSSTIRRAPPGALGLDTEPQAVAGPSAPAQETPGQRLRRVSSLAYVNSGIRDTPSRERSSHPKSRWLVVVIPPASLTNESGPLGHTLAQGPRSRLSNGCLMPLFPTMYAQLTAIAREFNFPSVTGICLYLHVVDNGLTFTPRVSDESWQLLWAHLFDPRSPAPTSQLPIGGRLEFDLDPRSARWFDSWAHRMHDTVSPPGFSQAASAYHGRNDSRTEYADEDDATSIAPRAKTHVPRKLSLVDRFDTASVRSLRLGGPRQPIPSFNADGAGPTQILTTIEQVEEPKSAKLALEDRVKSWRASASLKPTPLAATGQTSLEAANMPNSVEVPDVETADVLNLDDFTWALSSAGPPSDATHSPMGWYSPAPSPDLALRMLDDVPPTPTTLSSLGPADYDLAWSPASFIDRLPSPDLAWRMFEDVPPTPTTVSSLGPADYELAWSPQSNAFRLPSPDLAWRMLDDVPPTPTTVSSLGPADYELAWSPQSNAFRLPSPDLAWRMLDDVPPTPTTASSLGPASWPPSPRLEFRARTPDIGERAGWSVPVTPLQASFATGAAWAHVWPYTAARKSTPAAVWQHVWPYTAARAAVSAPVWQHVWPYASKKQTRRAPATVWQHVWPYTSTNARTVARTGYPFFDLYPAVRRTSRVKEPRMPGYPFLDVYPATYPKFDIYPAVAGVNSTREPVSLKLSAAYPSFDLYTISYPDFEIYPGHQCTKERQEMKRVLSAANSLEYPSLYLYYLVSPAAFVKAPLAPAVYPFFDLYPAGRPTVKVLDAPVDYPFFDVYPDHKSHSTKPRALVAGVFVDYPHFDLYPAEPLGLLAARRSATKTVVTALAPALLAALGYPESLRAVYPSKTDDVRFYKARAVGLPNADPSRYPNLVVYPAVGTRTTLQRMKNVGAQYPESLRAIYGSKIDDSQYYKSQSVWLLSDAERRYPALDVYPALKARSKMGKPSSPKTNMRIILTTSDHRPLKSPHPAVRKMPREAAPPMPVPRMRAPVPSSSRARQVIAAKTMSNALGYPTMVIYEAMYPYVEPYPAVQQPEPEVGPLYYGSYPTLVLYPACYPAFDIYPAIQQPEPDVGPLYYGSYPTLVLYPARYPAFDIYPAIQRPEPDVGPLYYGAYPSLVLYPARYPAFDMYPAILRIEERRGPLSVSLPMRYPTLDIYTPVYPSFRIYDVISKEEDRRAIVSVRLAPAYPAIGIYESVYPHLEVYPAASVARLQRLRTPAWRPKFTHAQLYAQVDAAPSPAPVSAPAPAAARTGPAAASTAPPVLAPATPRRRRKTHADLHDEVFPEGIVATPATMAEFLRPRTRSASIAQAPTPAPAPAPTPVGYEAAPARRPSLSGRSRSGTVSARPAVSIPPTTSTVDTPARLSPEAAVRLSPVSRRLPLAAPAPPPSRPLPPVSRGLPATPNQGRRVSFARPPSVMTASPGHVPVAPLSPLGEDEVVERSSRVRAALPPIPNGGASLERARSTNENRMSGVRPQVARRASLVSERAKVFDSATTSSADSQGTGQIMSTLAQFPLPPAPPIPHGLPSGPAVQKLDRSKFAAFNAA